MKTLEINLTPTEKVTLTYIASADQWDLFDGNLELLDRMAEDAGWNFQNTRQRLADWAAENKDLFVIEEKNQNVEQLWEGTKVEAEIAIRNEIERNGGIKSFSSEIRKNRPYGCPMKRMMIEELQNLSKEEIHVAFHLGLIGNASVKGSIVENSKY